MSWSMRMTSTVALLATLTSGCSGDAGLPDRDPDVVGVVSGTGASAVLVDASDGYFEGMGLLRGDPVIVRDDGKRLDPADISDGDPVQVWVDGPCAESFPVQCDIGALRIVGADDVTT